MPVQIKKDLGMSLLPIRFLTTFPPRYSWRLWNSLRSNIPRRPIQSDSLKELFKKANSSVVASDTAKYFTVSNRTQCKRAFKYNQFNKNQSKQKEIKR
jgi:hypothetical protein